MTTRIYCRNTAESTPISPTPDSAWEDTSILARALGRTNKTSDALATVAFSDSNSVDRDVLFRQYVSLPLVAGQTITGAQAIKAQCRVIETTTGNNMFFAVGIRVLASNGTTVQKTVLSVTRDAVEADAATLTNRQFTATSAATNYTTVAGDRLVIEIGMSGDPGGSSPHSSSMRLGDSAASDLAEDDTTTTDNNPWVQLNDTLNFVYSATAAVSAAPATSSSSATFSAGTKTAAGAATAAHATASGSGAVINPTYTSSGAPSAVHAIAAASATFAVPTYTGAAGCTTKGATCSGSAAFTAPTYTASGSATATHATASGSAGFTAPIYTASGSPSAAPATADMSGTFTPPTYSGTLAAIVSAATADVSATFSDSVPDVPRTVSRFTQLMPTGLPWRRYGSFGGRDRRLRGRWLNVIQLLRGGRIEIRANRRRVDIERGKRVEAT